MESNHIKMNGLISSFMLEYAAWLAYSCSAPLYCFLHTEMDHVQLVEWEGVSEYDQRFFSGGSFSIRMNGS